MNEASFSCVAWNKMSRTTDLIDAKRRMVIEPMTYSGPQTQTEYAPMRPLVVIDDHCPPPGWLRCWTCWFIASNRICAMLYIAGVLAIAGCTGLTPRPILVYHNHLPATLNDDQEPQVERGEQRPVIDAIGWTVGIPSKIVLWNRRIENHRISYETEAIVQEYLDLNGLTEVKVRLNQYRPLDDWRRLTRNTSVAWPWRYTFGVGATLGETILPGRIFGGDHYNPYTGTIHLYSDVATIGLHEAAHAKDFARRDYPGTYAAVYVLPIVPLFHESIASRDVFAYLEDKNDPELMREANHVLYPAYGTYVGNTLGVASPVAATPLYVGGVLVGHAIGRFEPNVVSDPAVDMYSDR